ncbi:MAG: TetR family transcriptional regulator, partial [Aeromicrobium sp.]|nr:TetR family transcriptional regulator [Aeromicrobium sp.]
MPEQRVATVRTSAVLDAMLEMILVEGFLSVSMADAARRLRCSKSTLYAIAASKEQLLV